MLVAPKPVVVRQTQQTPVPFVFQPAPKEPLPVVIPVEEGWEEAKLNRAQFSSWFIILSRVGKPTVWCGSRVLLQAGIGTVTKGTKFLVRINENNPKGPSVIEIKRAPSS